MKWLIFYETREHRRSKMKKKKPGAPSIKISWSIARKIEKKKILFSGIIDCMWQAIAFFLLTTYSVHLIKTDLQCLREIRFRFPSKTKIKNRMLKMYKEPFPENKRNVCCCLSQANSCWDLDDMFEFKHKKSLKMWMSYI